MLELIFLVGIAVLVTHLELKDRRHGQTVQGLLQRIQDPVAAVAQHVVQAEPRQVTHLPFDDDDAWVTYVEELSGEAS